MELYKKEVEHMFADIKQGLKTEEDEQIPHLPASEKVR